MYIMRLNSLDEYIKRCFFQNLFQAFVGHVLALLITDTDLSVLLSSLKRTSEEEMGIHGC